MRRPPLPSRTVSHVPTYRTIRALVPTDARSRFNRYEPAMTIATAANAVTLTPNTVTPFPESVIIITMAVINIAELDIHVAELPIDNAELSISVSEFAPNYPTVAGDNAKGSTSPATTLTPLLHLIIYIPFIKRVGWVVHCSLHGVIIGRESDTKSFVPFQGFALLRLRVVADIPESGLSDIRHHPPPRLPTGRLKRSKIKKPPLAVKKNGCTPEQKEMPRETPPRHLRPLPSPPQGAGVHTCCVLGGLVALLPLGEGWDGASMFACTHPWQLCRSCDYIAQGCGHGPQPWVMPPLILLLCKSCD